MPDNSKKLCAIGWIYFKAMKKIKELNKLKLPMVKIDKSLGEYKDKVLFKEKVEKANETLKKVGLPKTLQKLKA